MVSKGKHWKTLFFCTLGLAVGTAFCMKWMEPDFWLNGERISIMGLELFYPPEKLMAVLSGLDDKTKTIVTYHLSFDFMFMAGIFPCIASLCMMSSSLTHTVARKILFLLAVLQLLAWGCDIYENTRLLHWLKSPVITTAEFRLFHAAVIVKWIISLLGILMALPFFWRKGNR